ncbi:hypothetical protein MMC10_003430 [Thelotrema lepadinum]|nr:hypothetical protein [Thelotrema lepadinum]
MGLIQSSFSEDYLKENTIFPSRNGLLLAVEAAWSGHHHLVLRPEDFWFAILTQLGFYICAHAEELRSSFVSHEGQKEFTIIYAGHDMYGEDFGEMAIKMTKCMEKYIVDPDLRAWFVPDFSTTTEEDKVVGAILMMGAMQKYFSCWGKMSCGLPSVTLLGERADYTKLLDKLDRVSQLGDEPAMFAKLLRPVMKRLVASFDRPEDREIVKFWNQIAHRNGGSGTHYLSGWITAFAFWNEVGEMLYDLNPKGRTNAHVTAGCELDGVLYHRADVEKIPSGFTSVPFVVEEWGIEYKTRMIAGSVGIRTWSSGMEMDNGDVTNRRHKATGEPGYDTLQPESGWWMFHLESEDVRNFGTDED